MSWVKRLLRHDCVTECDQRCVGLERLQGVEASKLEMDAAKDEMRLLQIQNYDATNDVTAVRRELEVMKNKPPGSKETTG